MYRVLYPDSEHRQAGFGMKKIEVGKVISAAPEVVWEKLTDIGALVAGGLGIVSLTGEMRAGGRLKLVSEVAPGRAFALKVTEFVPGQRMVWTSGMPLGLFKGVRTFTLTPVPGGTELTMCEVFTGLMLPMIWKSMPDLTPSFQKFATGLKQLAERA